MSFNLQTLNFYTQESEAWGHTVAYCSNDLDLLKVKVPFKYNAISQDVRTQTQSCDEY